MLAVDKVQCQLRVEEAEAHVNGITEARSIKIGEAKLQKKVRNLEEGGESRRVGLCCHEWLSREEGE
ncbi:hypothetical protein BN1723_006944 [Verticillium longisporum]|uniref:Uncharacterized protein n=1 Tax=Verticillium longisporum TaxID=100787 RepID=A0A0G4LB76_VERLO|nr:hypothetical protein BN1708_012597 [Verticillium longisporum]CRK46213.1 hypothetical protein BN1723_006944 [Verticillium longisporum]